MTGALHHLAGVGEPGEAEVVLLEGGLGHDCRQLVTAPSDALETLLAYLAMTPVAKAGSGGS